MANNNKKEVADKALEAVSGGSIGIDIDPQKLIDMNREAEILTELENTPAQNDPGKSEENLTDMSIFSIVK